MLKRIYLVLLCLIFCAGNLWADTLTLTTYYPSPSGEYQDLQVMGNLGVGTTNPTTKLEVKGPIKAGNITIGNACSPEGALGYDMTVHKLAYCSSGNVWAQTGGGGAAPTYVGATPGSYNGSAVGGYSGGDAKCNTAFAGSRMCAGADFGNGRPTVTGWYNIFFDHSAYGDCAAWTSAAAGWVGQRWNVASGPEPLSCTNSQRILCCQ